jgi:hypothetical protein
MSFEPAPVGRTVAALGCERFVATGRTFYKAGRSVSLVAKIVPAAGRSVEMMSFGAQGFRLSLAALSVGILTSSAHAYLDPGTGSMILQVLLGGVAGLALVGKLYWHKLLSLLGIRKDDVELTAHDGSEARSKR